MLKEIGIEDIPKSNGKMDTPNARFARKTVREFCKMGVDAAEVSGWPDGEPADRKEAIQHMAQLRNAIHNERVSRSVVASQRGTRIFLIRKYDPKEEREL